MAGVGDDMSPVVIVEPSSFSVADLDWWTEYEYVAVVSAGTVSAMSEGSAMIWCGKDGVKASCQLSVVASTTSYSVTTNLTKCSVSNEAVSVMKGSSYECSVAADIGCKLVSVECTMGGVPQTVADGKVSIPFVTGDISITATARDLETYLVTFSGENYSASNSAVAATEDSAYECVVTPTDGYKLVSVTYSMSG